MTDCLNRTILAYAKDAQMDSDLIIKQLQNHSDIKRVLNLFQYEFSDISLLITAITHSSFLNETNWWKQHNEKLEFLGDSVLNILVSNVIYHLYPQASEGELSRLRSALVCEESLVKLAKFLALERTLLLGKGELHTLANAPSLLADCFEALLGAIYLDGGFSRVQMAFDHLMQRYLELEGEQFIHFDNLLEFDAKSILQEKTMREFKELPEYIYEKLESGDFKITVRIKGMPLASIEHVSKKKGAKALAKKVLQEKLLDKIIIN